jgi:hypothetical protein
MSKIHMPGDTLFFFSNSGKRIIEGKVTYVGIYVGGIEYHMDDPDNSKRHSFAVGSTPEEMIDLYYAERIKRCKDRIIDIEQKIEDYINEKESKLEELFVEKNRGGQNGFK